MAKLALTASALQAGIPVRLRVAGISMIPLLWPGDSITIRAAVPADLSPGDVIAFTRDGGVIVHRITGLAREANSSMWITRGDSQLHDDAPVQPQELLGVVTNFWRFGAVHPIDRCPSRLAHALSEAVRKSNLARFLLTGIYSRLMSQISAAQDARAV